MLEVSDSRLYHVITVLPGLGREDILSADRDRGCPFIDGCNVRLFASVKRPKSPMASHSNHEIGL